MRRQAWPVNLVRIGSSEWTQNDRNANSRLFFLEDRIED